jgi:O-antigen ligase
VAASEANPPGEPSLKAAVVSAVSSPFWRFGVDLWAILIAVSIPWSTSAVGVFSVIWLLALIPTINRTEMLDTLRRPACWLPIALVVLAVVGTVWADGPWRERLLAILPALKLLAIPLFMFHFARSARGNWVFIAFLVSCTILMALSWVVLWDPGWKISNTELAGVPLKNAISQNQEFALCAFGLAYAAWALWRQDRRPIATAAVLLMLAFIANILFAALARTALVYLLALSVLFVALHFGRRMTIWLVPIGAVAIAAVWFISPHLRERVEHIAVELREYKETNRPTSAGQRLAFWQMSLKWIAEAPVAGHGTGSAKRLFVEEAVGKDGAWAQTISNPHNQTLYVAIQWGALGCIFLYAMWFYHILLFRGPGLVNWIGLMVVVQNIFSSLLNSHLFDFHEGWIYVLGVGVAGGMVLRSSTIDAPGRSH